MYIHVVVWQWGRRLFFPTGKRLTGRVVTKESARAQNTTLTYCELAGGVGRPRRTYRVPSSDGVSGFPLAARRRDGNVRQIVFDTAHTNSLDTRASSYSLFYDNVLIPSSTYDNNDSMLFLFKHLCPSPTR